MIDEKPRQLLITGTDKMQLMLMAIIVLKYMIIFFIILLSNVENHLTDFGQVYLPC